MLPALQPYDPQAPWQPRLGWWGHTWRLLLLLSISALAWIPAMQTQWERRPQLLWLDLGLGAASYVAVLWRRRWPFAVACLTTVLSAGSGIAGGPATLATVSLATRRSYVQIAVVGVLGVLGGESWVLLNPQDGGGPRWLISVFNVVLVVAVLVFGMYVGSRRELLWTLRERAKRAETEQALRVEQARATERARIAREMHDVLGHRISLVSMHAGALSFRDDLDRGQVADSARVILDNAHLAMAELRSVLGVLRGEDGEPTPDQPPPTLADVAALVAEAEASGMHVELVQAIAHDAPLPPGTARTVFRVVQEGLTNVRRHAPATHARVELRGAPGEGVVVRVENPLPIGARHGSGDPGFGIVGLAERAHLGGGRLRTASERGRFVLEVELPWPV